MAKISNIIIMLSDLITCFALLFALLGHVMTKDILGFTSRLGFVLIALGMGASFVFQFDKLFLLGSPPVWAFPIWGLKDVGITVLIFGLWQDLKKRGVV